MWRKCGAGNETRTRDLLFTRQLLYQLSYAGNKWYDTTQARTRQPCYDAIIYAVFVGDTLGMHDQPIQLDAGFDTMPHLTVSSWLHTIDSRVVSGEPIVIIDDGTTQRVMTAPCTGRIVDIYTEAGATVIPRTVLGMVRPDLIMPEPARGFGSILMGIIMIGLALIAIPFISNFAPRSTQDLVPITHTAIPQTDPSNQIDEPATDAPMPDTPLPGSSPNDESDESENADIEPDAQTDPATIDVPTVDTGDPTADGDTSTTDPNQLIAPTPTDITDDTTDSNGDIVDPNLPVDDDSNDTQEPTDVPPPTFSTNDDIDWTFNVEINNLITLTEEVERNLPSGVMSQSQYDDIVSYASSEAVRIIDELSSLITRNRNNTDINEKNRRWFALFNDAKDDCLAIYVTIQQSVKSQQPIPNLTSSFTGCYVLRDNF